MDYSSKTVAELRSILTANGVAVPQTYLKKADLVELCNTNLKGKRDVPLSPPSRTVSGSRSRKSSTVRRQSSRHSRIVDSDSDHLPAPTRKAERTPSPEPVAEKKTFSGRPSLSSPAIGRRKISVTPMSTMPPRPKSFASRDRDSSESVYGVKSRFGILLVAVVSVFGAMYLFSTSAPRVPLCNTNGTPPSTNATCVACPKLGSCSGGTLKACADHFIIHGDQCVRDEAKFVNAMAIIDSVGDLLSSLHGRKECGDDIVDSLSKEQIRVLLRSDYRSLSDPAFSAAFDLAFNGNKKEGLSIPSYITTTPLGLYRSQFAHKSVTCRVRQFFNEWIWTIVISVIVVGYVLVKFLRWKAKRDMTFALLRTIETHTHYHDGRVQGLSVLDLRDTGMPLQGMQDQEARKIMSLMVRTYPDIQCGEEIHRAGETVYWSAHRLRAEQSRPQSPMQMDPHRMTQSPMMN